MKRSGTLAIRMTLDATLIPLVGLRLALSRGNAILQIFRYLSFTGGRILDHRTLPTKADYSIAVRA